MQTLPLSEWLDAHVPDWRWLDAAARFQAIKPWFAAGAFRRLRAHVGFEGEAEPIKVGTGYFAYVVL